MSDEKFVAPRHVVISSLSAASYISSLVGNGLSKDLRDDQEICEHCHGTGITISDNIYGIKGDHKKDLPFPYVHQAFTFCNHCFNGVVHRCKHCGKLLPKGLLRDNCPGAEAERKLAEAEREAEIFAAAKEWPSDALGSTFGMCFYGDAGSEGYFSDWDEFFDYWEDVLNDYPSAKRPTHVSGTVSDDMTISASDIVDQACEELYEGARGDVHQADLKLLQEFLDVWCQTCGVRRSYMCDDGHKVLIPWEEYDKERPEL